MRNGDSTLNLRQWLIKIIFIMICLGYYRAAMAEKPGYPYICSNGQVYSVRVDARTSGVSTKGPWRKFLGFCNASIGSLKACVADNSHETAKCLQEFKERGNV